MSVEAINAKKVVVEEIAGKFNDSQSAVVVEYRGLSVAEVTELRKALREEDVEFKVYKNKLVQRATESAGYAEINDKLVGPNAIAFGHSDAVAPARILAKFAKDHEALVIKAGIVEVLFSQRQKVVLTLAILLLPVTTFSYVLLRLKNDLQVLKKLRQKHWRQMPVLMRSEVR